MFYRRFGKRALDIAGATVGIIFTAPLLAATAVAVRIEDGGPSIFRQTRVGQAGESFLLFKFRSMPLFTPDVPSAEAASVRVTRVGAIIRRFNIDELPQLFNILRGDMSLVGPRPALSSQINLNRLREEHGALVCRPGLTGLAQVSSYDGMPEDEKAAFDGSYASRITLLGDIRILISTVGYLLRRPPTY